MKTISLKEFILTGDFGPVKIGMNKKEVIKLLGQPDEDVSFGESGNLLYGWYEFFYNMETQYLEAIQNDHIPCSGFKNSKFIVDTWIIKNEKEITFKEIISKLIEEKIQHEITKEFGLEVIKFESGIYFDFDNKGDGIETRWDENEEKWMTIDVEPIKNRDDYLLNGIRHFPVFRK